MMVGPQNGMTMPFPKYDIQPVYSIQQAVERREQMVSFVKQIMVDGIDFGVIPGTDKPTLLKPGAEKLLSFFGLSVTLQSEKVEDWSGSEHGGEPLFAYTYRACAFRGPLLIAQADGHCNTWEGKYRYRNADRLCPECGQPTILKSKDKPEFFCWRKKGGCGATFSDSDPRVTDQVVGKVPNQDPHSLINTVQKMAQKRAIVAVALLAVNASEFFTQDVEDMVDSYPADKAPAATATPAASAPQDAHRGERDAIQVYLAALPPAEAEKRRAEIAKALKVDTFNLLDVDTLPADWLTWITNRITKWEKAKPVDDPAPSPPTSTPAHDPQQATADAVIVPAVLTGEEQAAIIKAESKEQAQADDELVDPFAD